MKKAIYFLFLILSGLAVNAQIDAGLVTIKNPPISCFGDPQIIYVDLINNGVANIPTNAAAITLKISGSNDYVN
ncbi:MAG: hypothetical protein FGM46_01840, partial [Ferruginibacter sp.]|nr:hypothetical protein [Ferruginibacter sp.]